MRIGYDAKRYFNNRSGLGNYSRDLVRILHEYSPDNDYVLYTPKKPTNPPVLNNVTVRYPQHGIINRMLPSFWRSRTIVDDLQRDEIDIYHGLSGEIPLKMKSSGIKSIVSMHDLIFLRYPQLYKPLDRYIYKKKFSYAVHHADKIVAISKQTKSDLIHYFGLHEEQIDVIYQGCHPAFKTHKTKAQLDEIQARYNLPTDFILNVGSIEPRKNAFQIVKAIEDLDIPLVIIGKETEYALEIKKYIQSKNLQHKVLFRKVQGMEDLACIYKLSKAFVYPSTYEGFGIPIIEALYAGTPVITTDSGVFPEAAGPFSYFVNPKRIEEIKHGINSVLTSSTMQEEMIEKGLEFVQQFNDDILAKQWIDCYKKIF
ncbi:glycosyltransferase family 4 protein [Sphingobacterium sp. LRF_L2]|uniref:glycosyltransferase family 4 protein n=1 Tax=Sphingobacterium sp. LRF_L2 TaxID=3369421 RepID=UPI003F5DB6E1